MPDSLTIAIPPAVLEFVRQNRKDLILPSGEVDIIAVEKIVESLPTKQKKEMFLKWEEKKRRLTEERSRYYVPMPIQLEAHQCSKKVRIVAGGNQSGKTEFAIQEANRWALGTNSWRPTPNPPVSIRICSPSWRDGIGKTIIPKIKEVVVRSDLVGGSWESGFNKSLSDIEQSMTVQYKNGSFFELMTYEQDVAKFGGTQRYLIIHDEEPPLAIYQENMARTAQTNGEIIIAMTPVKGSSWVSRDLIDEPNDDLAVFYLPTMDNIHLPQESRDALYRQFSQDPDLAATRLFGQFISIGGLVFKSWREDRDSWRSHVIADSVLPAGCIYVIAIDPAPAKAHAAVWAAIDPSTIHLNKYPRIWFYKELLGNKGSSIEEFCHEIQNANKGQYVDYMIIDPHWDWDNNAVGGMNIYREFKKFFPQLRPGQANRDDIYYEALKNRMIFDDLNRRVGVQWFANGCPKAAKQMKNLAYKQVDETRGQLTDVPKVRRVNNDLVDCCGMVAADWIAQSGRQTSYIQPTYIRDQFGHIIG